MEKTGKRMTILFGAGVLGALAKGFVTWILATLGIPVGIWALMSSAYSPGWAYYGLVWGGLWGFLFFIPVLKRRHIDKGVLLSLVPTIIQLFRMGSRYITMDSVYQSIAAKLPAV
jgi:hypothetical protein